MTVRQLIDALSRMPQDEPVVIEDNGGDVEVVEVDESNRVGGPRRLRVEACIAKNGGAVILRK